MAFATPARPTSRVLSATSSRAAPRRRPRRRRPQNPLDYPGSHGTGGLFPGRAENRFTIGTPADPVGVAPPRQEGGGTNGTPSTPAPAQGQLTPGFELPPPPPRPAPQLPSSVADVASAGEALGTNISDINSQLMNAAFRYGGSPTVTQYRLDENGVPVTYEVPVSTNENSLLNQIQRAYQDQVRNAGQSHNAQNTFFSGLHQSDVTRVGEEADRSRQNAYDEFQQALGELSRLLDRVYGEYQGVVRGAGAADIEASQSQEPEEGGLAEKSGAPGGRGLRRAPQEREERRRPRRRRRRRR